MSDRLWPEYLLCLSGDGRSDNPLAQKLKEEGVPIEAGPWALVEFENGKKLMVRKGMGFEKMREQ